MPGSDAASAGTRATAGSRAAAAGGRVLHRLTAASVVLRTGIVHPTGPRRAVRCLNELRRWGASLAAGYVIAAIRYPDQTAIIDELGALSFLEVEERTNALARALARRGIREGDGIAVMCRNHRGFIEITIAAVKLGANLLYLNTEFAAPAIATVMRREGPKALVYDEEFAALVEEGASGVRRFLAWQEPGAAAADDSLEQLIREGDTSPLAPPAEPGRVVILTSGTTGAPKGALRRPPANLEPAAAILSRIPLRARQTTVIAAPLFHSWGFAHFMLGTPLSSTLVLRRRFDPEETLRLVSRHRASTLVVVPVMLQRMLELAPETRSLYDLTSLRAVASSGSALPGELATRVMDAFGDVLYNLYGTTEVAWVSIATPADLRAAPGTAGRPPFGTTVRLLDDDEGRDVAPGERGRIFASNSFVFEGYTDGSGKPVVAGLTDTGDIGHFDSDGRLFVDGRGDEMIVSGGENVYPREVEDLLADHDQIEDAAVVGVEDSEFGERLRAFVVPRNGASLSEEDVKLFVRQNLARYKVPREVVFLEALPRNASGKVLKRELEASGG
jgi:acyl-CoA synthetase (AMP-forming)/AMP-acid ligase II